MTIEVAGRPGVPAIIVDRISKSFQRRQGGSSVEALAGVSFKVRANSFVTLFGPSGCGKTTMLRLLNGLLQPDEGAISVYGRPPAPGHETGFVFQSPRLLPWRTVRGNVSFPLELQTGGQRPSHDRIEDILERVGLADFAESYPNELSGGMAQRAALARALVVRPRLLLMDEPFANLDAQAREFMQIELLRIWQMLDCEVVFVTHSVDEAIILSDQILVMSPRPGRIVEAIEVDLPRPRTESDVRGMPEFARLRTHLWDQIKRTVSSV